jgi:hypothetical protein
LKTQRRAETDAAPFSRCRPLRSPFCAPVWSRYATCATHDRDLRTCGPTTASSACAIYLGELPVGYCIARLNARRSYLESAPIHFLTDPPGLAKVTDADLAARL